MELSVREAATLMGRSQRTVRAQLARDLALISPGGVRFASERLRSIGRMVGGWRKRVERSSLPPADDDTLQGAGHPAAGA